MSSPKLAGLLKFLALAGVMTGGACHVLASEMAVPLPDANWHYAFCESNADVTLQLTYKIEEVTHGQTSFKLQRQPREPAQSEERNLVGAGFGSVGSRRASPKRVSGTITPAIADKGVVVAFHASWLKEDQWESLEETVFVPYEGTTFRTNGLFQFRGHFEMNNSVPSPAQERLR